MSLVKRILKDALTRSYWLRYRGQPLALMHVPKTAGTSVMKSVAVALLPSIDVRGFDRSLFGDFQAWETLGPALRRDVYLTPQEMPAGAQTVMGHFALSTLVARYPNARLATFLREPASRLLSHFVFWRCHNDAMLAPSGAVWAGRVMLSRGELADFLCNKLVAAQTDNILTRMLLWPHALIPPDGFIDPANDQVLLRAARERLSWFDHIGFVEMPGGVFPGFSDFLRCRLTERWLNQTPAVPPSLGFDLRAALTPEVRALLQARSRLDLVLWQEIAGASGDPERLRRETLNRTVATLASRLAAGTPAPGVLPIPA